MPRPCQRLFSSTLLAIALGLPLAAADAQPGAGPQAADEKALSAVSLRVQKAGQAATAEDLAELATANEKLGRPAEAAAALDRAVSAGFAKPGTAQRLGRLLEAAGQFGKAAIAYKRALGELDAKAGAELAQRIGDLLAGQQLDYQWGATEYLDGAKRFPGQPATRQALINCWNIGGDKGEPINQLRYQAEELLLRQFPGDAGLRGFQVDWFNRARGNPPAFLQVWDLVTKADPAAATAPELALSAVFATRARGLPAEQIAQAARDAFKRSGDLQTLWDTAGSLQGPQRAALFLTVIDELSGHPLVGEAAVNALDSGADAAALTPRLERIERIHAGNGDLRARIAAVRAQLAGDDATRTAQWKLALEATPWPIRDRVENAAAASPAVMEVLAQSYATRAKAGDGNAQPVGFALAMARVRTAGEDPAKLGAAIAQYLATFRDFGLVNDDLAWGALDRFGNDLLSRGGVTAEVAEKAYADLLECALSPRIRRHAGERAANTLTAKGKAPQGAALAAKAEDMSLHPVTRLLAQVDGAPNNGARAQLLLDTVRKPDGLPPSAVGALRGSVVHWSHQDGPMSNQLPEIAREFMKATDDAGWAGQFVRYVRERNRQELFDEAAATAKRMLAGAAKGDAAMLSHAGTILLMQNKPAEALALVRSALTGDPSAWPTDAIGIAAAGAARTGDKATYDAMVGAFIARGEWNVLARGLLYDHGAPDAWRTPLLQQLLDKSTDRGAKAMVLRQIGDWQWRSDFKGFQANRQRLEKEVPEAAREREWFLTTDLQAAVERNDAPAQIAGIELLLTTLPQIGVGNPGYVAQALQGAISARMKEAGPATAARWLGGMLDLAGATPQNTWAARALYDLQYPADRIAAAMTLHRLVRTGWRDDAGGFDRVYAEVDKVAKAGDHGIAAGAFQNMARWFNPAAVGAQRIEQAKAMASTELAKTGAMQAIDDNDPRAPLLRAGALIAAGDEEEAYRLIRDRLKLLEDNLGSSPADLVLLAARNLIREERTDQARRILGAFNRLLGDNPANAEPASHARLLLGEAAFADENQQVALSEFQTVVATWPKSPWAAEAALRIGDSYWAQRQMAQARTAFEQIAAGDDRLMRIKARFRLALLASEEGRRDEAFDMMRQLAADNPPKDLKSQMFLDWSKLLLDSNRLKEAEDLLTQIGLASTGEPIAPGEPVKITLTDTFLQTSQNRSTVPVTVRAKHADGSPGDQEKVELVVSQDIKGLFVGSIPTALGAVVPGDHTLQVLGTDVIGYDYAPEFKKGRDVPDLSKVEIRVAASGEIRAASTASQARFGGDREDEPVRSTLPVDPEESRRQNLLAGSKSRTFRSGDQIKPGNPIYVALRDSDQDVSDAPDAVNVRVESSGGDQVLQKLVETSAHSGIFSAVVKTALRSADLRVSDSAPGSDPLGMLRPTTSPDFDRADKAWIALGDRKLGKTVTLDMKSPVAMDRFAWSRGMSEAARKAGPKAVPEWIQGLAGTFYEGNDLERGRKVHALTGEPRYDLIDLPGHGPNNYSDRWVGEIQIPSDGTWTIGVKGDDGVRLAIDDKVIADGWRSQGATLYAADAELSAGWHRIRIEHFQGGGGASLDLLMAPKGQELKSVTREQLRCRPGHGGGGPVSSSGIDRRITSFRVECSSDGRWWTPLFDTTPSDRQALAGRFSVVARDVKRPVRSAREALGVLSDPANRYSIPGETLLRSAGLTAPAAAQAKPEYLLNGVMLVPEAGSYAFAWTGTGRAFVMVGDQLLIEKGLDEADAAQAAGEPRWRGTIDDLPFGHVPLRILLSSDRGPVDGKLLWKRPGRKDFEPVPAVAVDGQASAEDIAAYTGRALPAMAWADDRWAAEVKFPPVTARFLRMVINGWEDGDSPALASVRLFRGTDTILPATGVDYGALGRNDIVELSPGDTVQTSYVDERTKQTEPATVRARLDATYYNGTIDFVDARNELDNGRLAEKLYPRYRFKAGERITVQVADYDGDVSDKPDSFDVTFRSSLGQVTIKATETGDATGLFQAEVRTVRAPAAGATAPDKNALPVADGDQVWATYLDVENTIPGGPAKRTRAVREAANEGVRVAVSPSTAARPATAKPGSTVLEEELVVSYATAIEDAGVALAPLRIEIIDAAAMISAASTVRVRLTTESGASLDVDLEPGNADGDAFVGNVPLVLGDRTSPTWRLPAPGEARSIGARLAAAGEDVPLGAHPVLPVQGGERITVTRLVGAGPKSTPEEVAAIAAKPDLPRATARLAGVPELLSMQPNEREPVTVLYVGGELRLLTIDPAMDATPGRDKVRVAVASGLGDRMDLELEESEAHSGRFSAVLPLALAKAAVAGDDVVQVGFGDTVSATYARPGTAKPVELVLPVAKGDDARLAAFAKHFGDDSLAARSQVRLAECYFELYKSHREELKKLKEQKGKEAAAKRLQAVIADELAEGTALLQRTIRDFGDSGERDQLLYLLGNFEQESERHAEAIEQYTRLLAAYPDSASAPEAQYKIAQCYEEMQRFDEAWEHYVRLAYRWPQHARVGDAMVRIGVFYRNRAKKVYDAALKEWQKSKAAGGTDMQVPKPAADDWLQAAAVYGKFVERFKDHELVDKVALTQGDCYLQARDYLRAIRAFDRITDLYPTAKAKGLYWGGRACMDANQVRDALVRFQRLLQDFPESTEAKYARGLMVSDPRLVDAVKSITNSQ